MARTPRPSVSGFGPTPTLLTGSFSATETICWYLVEISGVLRNY
jgi:hypothetical protein